MAESKSSDLTGPINSLVNQIKAYREEQQTAERKKALREKITIGLLIATTVGVSWQVNEMVKVYDPIQQQSAAMERQAKALEETFAASKEQQRAIISFPGYRIVGPVALIGNPDTTGFALIPQLINLGSTRTSRFAAWASVHYFDKEVPNNMDFNKPYTQLDNFAGSVVGPFGIAETTPVTLTSDEINKAINKEGVVLFWGYFEYADIFNPKDIKTNHFCIRVIPLAPKNGLPQFQTAQFRPDCNKTSN